MNKNNRYTDIDRREFIKVSAAAVAGAAALIQAGKIKAKGQNDSVKPFKIDVSEAVLNDLRERLARTRFPDQIEHAGWNYGTDLSYLKELCAYWRSKFDWRAQERALNRFDHFCTEIDGLNIHFIHQRSKEAKAIPLIMIHGWPSSFVEFTKIIGPLTDPASHGGLPQDAFHVICPSLPGYGFSEAPRKSGFGLKQITEILVKLMARLGYTHYGAQGQDWGSYISCWIAALDTPHVKGLHLRDTVANPPDTGEKMSPEEKRIMEQLQLLMFPEGGYIAIQSSRPQSLGYALNDSPAGLAAWIVEKIRRWSDCGGDVEKRFTKDELLTNIMIYWVTQTITSSMRLYYEVRASDWKLLPEEKTTVPVGFALSPFGQEIPRKEVEKFFNVTHWKVMPSGGHFPALEEPDLLVKDIRKFFRDLR